MTPRGGRSLTRWRGGRGRAAAQPRALRLAARGLGLFSIGLGLVELLAPRGMARVTGMQGRERLIAGYGVREIATGIGLLVARNPAPWVWGRIAGDALDLATIAPRLDQWGPRRRERAGRAFGAVLGVTALDLACAAALTASGARGRAAAPAARDYSDRSGFPRPPEAMRGVAATAAARGMRAPERLRPYTAA